MIQKFDKLWLGALIGTIIPIIVIIIIFLEEKYDYTFIDFVIKLFNERFLSAFIRIGLIGNLAVFLITFNTGFDKLPRGILMATIIYGMFIVYRFLW